MSNTKPPYITKRAMSVADAIKCWPEREAEIRAASKRPRYPWDKKEKAMLKVTLTAEQAAKPEAPVGEYVVRFKHYKDHRRPHTKCEIIYPNQIVMATGIAWCWHSDKYNGEVGQRLSLARALEGRWARVHPCRDTRRRHKATRTIFWDAYWDRFKRRKAPTLREKLVERADDYCQCPAGKTPCECGEELCMVCELLHDVLGQGVMPDHKIDCAECGFPACGKRDARYHPGKKIEVTEEVTIEEETSHDSSQTD